MDSCSKITYYLVLLCCMLFVACHEEEKPMNLMPVVTVEEATEITRTSATLSGKVETVGNGVVNAVAFRYGITPDMETEVRCDAGLSRPTATLTGLKAGTTYYYCLKAGNEHSTVSSRMLSFTTLPNRLPAVGDIVLLSQGPLSIILQYELKDDGGEPVTSTGFYYRAENQEEQCLAITPPGGELHKARISKLNANTPYTVQAFATNSIGEARSEVFHFETKQAVLLTTPGTLPETMDEYEKYMCTTLSIAGPLNGTDLRFIREMLGRTVDNKETPGRMSVLNLADASIVDGGLSYNGTRYSQADTIGYGMFKDCIYLQELTLPDGTKVIEENAFKDSPALMSIQIPVGTLELAPSTGCTALTSIKVSEANVKFSAVDGVLYDKNQTSLLWFPEGKTDDTFLLPNTVVRLNAFAFQGCRIREITLPASLQEIGKGAFFNAGIEAVIIPDKVKLIPSGVFQNCSRLTSVTLGSSVELLSEYCFEGCPLQHLYIKAPDFPPVCREETFAGAEELFTTCTLYVPKGCKSLYRSSKIWSNFTKIKEMVLSDAPRYFPHGEVTSSALPTLGSPLSATHPIACDMQ